MQRILVTHLLVFNFYGYDLDDFIQEGNYALFKALKNFNPKRNVIFYTFVMKCATEQCRIEVY